MISSSLPAHRFQFLRHLLVSAIGWLLSQVGLTVCSAQEVLTPPTDFAWTSASSSTVVFTWKLASDSHLTQFEQWDPAQQKFVSIFILKDPGVEEQLFSRLPPGAEVRVRIRAVILDGSDFIGTSDYTEPQTVITSPDPQGDPYFVNPGNDLHYPIDLGAFEPDSVSNVAISGLPDSVSFQKSPPAIVGVIEGGSYEFEAEFTLIDSGPHLARTTKTLPIHLVVSRPTHRFKSSVGSRPENRMLQALKWI